MISLLEENTYRSIKN